MVRIISFCWPDPYFGLAAAFGNQAALNTSTTTTINPMVCNLCHTPILCTTLWAELTRPVTVQQLTAYEGMTRMETATNIEEINAILRKSGSNLP